MELNKTASKIYHKEFEQKVILKGLETFSQEQVAAYINQLGDILEKSETAELSEVDKQNEELIKAEINSLTPHAVLYDNHETKMVFTREPQIEWSKSEDGNLLKGKSGTYLDTELNRKLERVGSKYVISNNKEE